MRGRMDSCSSLREQLTMQLCALTAATHITDIVDLSYSKSLMYEYLALVDGLGLYATTGL